MTYVSSNPITGSAITHNIIITKPFITIAKVRIIRGISKEYFKVIDTEDTAVAYLAVLARGVQLYVAQTSVKEIS